MSEMSDALTAQLGDRVRTNSAVDAITCESGRYQVSLAGGRTEEADVVVLASPAYAQAAILQDLAPDIALLLNGISYPPLSVVCTGYRKQDLGAYLDG